MTSNGVSATDIATTRHITLDALRGFAVMGILAMNIIGFAMPEWGYVSPAAYGGTTPVDIASWAFSNIFIDGKMRGLFSLLFGASMLLVIDRAEAKGESPGGVHFRRMAWLALFGLAHFFLLWFGDILFLYASVGCIAFLFRGLKPKALIIAGLSIFAFGLLINGGQFGAGLYAQEAVRAGTASDAVKAIHTEFAKEMDKINTDVPKELKIYRGSYAGIVDYKWTEKRMSPLLAIAMSVFETLPLMMIGMALLKSGFLTGAWDNGAYRKWAWRLVPLGLILTAVTTWIPIRSGFDPMVTLTMFIVGGAIPKLMLTIGYAALLVLLVRRMAGSPLLARVAATGRAAFSNYLGTTIVMTTIFYGYGLGLFGSVGRPVLWLIVIAAWGLMLLWSKPWLDRFAYGPLEWLWRSLARGQLQPMRKS